MRFLFDSAVVGSAADVSRAKAALRTGVRFIARKTNAYGRGKHRAGEKYVRREERRDVQKIQAESVRLIFTGKFGDKFTRHVRMRIGRNGRIKSSARGRGEKTGRKCSVPTKTVAGKVSRGQGESVCTDGNGELRENR